MKIFILLNGMKFLIFDEDSYNIDDCIFFKLDFKLNIVLNVVFKFLYLNCYKIYCE